MCLLASCLQFVAYSTLTQLLLKDILAHSAVNSYCILRCLLGALNVLRFQLFSTGQLMVVDTIQALETSVEKFLLHVWRHIIVVVVLVSVHLHKLMYTTTYLSACASI